MQDYPQTQWIIVDDGSSDETVRIVEDFLKVSGQPGLFLIHPTNQGLSRTLNDGLREATSPLVLIVHQDIEPVGSDWLIRAVSKIQGDDRVGVVTCYYGLAAPDDFTFTKRAFGFLRRQFHRPPRHEQEFVTFTEFKCDLVRRAVLDQLGGFSTEFRISGEDIMASYLIRRHGWRILKVYSLRAVQRFSGQAETLLGNLNKEFRFGESIAGVLLAFRGYAFQDLGTSPYARTRSLHRASQPLVAAAIVSLAVVGLLLRSPPAFIVLAALVIGRYAYYVHRVWPEFREAMAGRSKAVPEALGAGFLGLASDFVYPLGIATGVARSVIGAPL